MLGILAFTFVAIKLSEIIIPNDSVVSKNLVLERAKLIISILGPALTLIVFVRTIQTQLESSKNLIKDNVSKDFYNLLNLFKSIQDKMNSELFSTIEKRIKVPINNINTNLDVRENKETTKEVQEDLKEYSASLNKVLSESVKKINEIFEDNYKDIVSYLKVFHRILKILNNRYESKDISHEEYKMYVGILRSQIEDYEFYIILINSLFTLRGTGMGIELIETSFFGDELDIDLKQHFEHPEFLTEIIKDNFVEKKSYRESVKTRKKNRKLFENRKINDNLLSLLRIRYTLQDGNKIIISNGV
ncbi:hypothetical protein ABI025_05540 [Enterococcus faecium]